MSEYQYYEFAAIDRPLRQNEMDELGRLSSRAKITPTSFVNVYNFGGFRGDPRKLMDKYFDAFLYVANWGTRRLMFRLPKRLFDVKRASKYCDGERLTLRAKGANVVLEIEYVEEGGDWIDGEGLLQSLLPLREQLLSDDLRCLYLVWLAGIDSDEVDDDATEPPVPAGMGKLSGPLHALANLILLDEDLIAAAAAGDHRSAPETATQRDLAAWLAEQAPAEKDAWLLRVSEGESVQVRMEIMKESRETRAAKVSRAEKGSTSRPRTIRELLDAREGARTKRVARKHKLETKRQARLEREKMAAREKRLDDLATRGSAAWREADRLASAGVARAYDEAIALLVDLRDLAARSGRTDQAHAQLAEFRTRYATKTALMRRFKQAGLLR
jgi:hypothetical protein